MYLFVNRLCNSLQYSRDTYPLASFRKQHIELKNTRVWQTSSSSQRLKETRKRTSQNYVKKRATGAYIVYYSRDILLPQLSFPSLFKDTINNRLFRSRRDVIESRFLSAPTFQAVLRKRLTYKITNILRKLVHEISHRRLTMGWHVFANKKVIHLSKSKN